MHSAWINPWRPYECVLWSNNQNPLVCLKEPARCYVVCFFQRYRTTPWKINTNNGGLLQMIFLFQGLTFRFHGWRMSYTERLVNRQGIPVHWTSIWKLCGCDFDCLALTPKKSSGWRFAMKIPWVKKTLDRERAGQKWLCLFVYDLVLSFKLWTVCINTYIYVLNCIYIGTSKYA